MRNFKKTTCLTIALLAAFSFSACGENTPEETSVQTAGVTTVMEQVTENADIAATEILDDIPEEVYDDGEVIDEVDDEVDVVGSADGYIPFERVVQVGTKDEYDGVSFDGDRGYVKLSMDIPDYMSMDNTIGNIEGKKAFEIMDAAWSAEEGFSPEGMKTDMVSGRTVTVYEEQEGEGGLYEYMLHSSVPDHYSESGIYETYMYIVKRGEYMMSMSFLAEFYDKDTAERMLSSVEIAETAGE